MSKKIDHIGIAIKVHRRARGLSQEALGQLCHLDRVTVAGIERGVGNLSSFLAVLSVLEMGIGGLPQGDTLGDRIASVRRSTGISQRGLAKLCKVSHPTIVALEVRSTGRLDTLQRVLDRLGTDARLVSGHRSVILYEGNNLDHLRGMNIEADVCITSPPYFQKFDYEHAGQFGLEPTVDEFIARQVGVFHEVQRLLVEGGTCFIVIGDTSNNYSPVRAKHQRKTGHNEWLFRRKLQTDYREKEILNVPLRLAEGLRADGWVHRNTLIWDKGRSGVMANSDTAPECHEYILHMMKWSKRSRPYGNTKPLKSSVLRHGPSSHHEHGCAFPESLVEELLRSCPARGTVIDPYIGSGTIGVTAARLGYAVHGFGLDCSTAATACPGAALIRGESSSARPALVDLGAVS